MEQFALYFKQFLSSGIYHTDKVPALQVHALTGLQTKLDPGSAYIEGFMYNNTDPITFTHDTADITNPRIDRIVLRLDKNVNSRFIKAFIKSGSASATPQPPDLERDDVIYEISLAQVKIDAGALEITSITDERLNSKVAGLVSSLISIPTEQFQKQWDDWFTSRQNATGVKVTTGSVEPIGIAAGDIWFKNI